jgi:outer membrane protein assembly factor BamB
MRYWSRFFVIILALAAVGGCRRTKGPEAVHPDVLAKGGLKYYWTLQLNLSEDETVARIKLLDENLYCLTSFNRLVALDAARGLVKWSHQVAGSKQTVFPLTHADNVLLPEKVSGLREILANEKLGDIKPFDAVFVNTLGCVLVLDRANGKLYRKIQFDFAAHTGGASDGINFYVASTKGWYYAIRLREATKMWWLDAQDMISAPVKYFTERLYVTNESGSLIVTDVAARHGEKQWTRQLGGAVTAEFHVGPKGCFLPCDDNRLYGFDATDGEELWEPFICQAPLHDPVQVGEDTIFQLARGDKFYAIDLRSGKEQWSLANGQKVLGVFGGNVYLLSIGGALLVVDKTLGAVKTSLAMVGWELTAGNVSSPAIYVAMHDGRLACIREAGTEYLTPEMLKE